MIEKHLTLGGSSARADIERGTVLETIEARQADADKLWPRGQGRLNSGIPGTEGHPSMDGKSWFVWEDLRREWVEDYTAVIEAYKQKGSD